MKGHQIWTGIPAIDLGTPLEVNAAANNTMSLIMNANPNGGNMYYFPGLVAPAPETLNPVQTYVTKYAVYRPTGAKVTITLSCQDLGATTPQIATPFTLYGFPAILAIGAGPGVTTLANYWNGTTANGFTATTVPQMKYGWRRISPGLGGKNMVKFTAYYDFAKIAGLTKTQFDSWPTSSGLSGFSCQPDENSTNPAIQVALILGIADYTGAQIRQIQADIKITQYGRWEGQNPDFT